MWRLIHAGLFLCAPGVAWPGPSGSNRRGDLLKSRMHDPRGSVGRQTLVKLAIRSIRSTAPEPRGGKRSARPVGVGETRLGNCPVDSFRVERAKPRHGRGTFEECARSVERLPLFNPQSIAIKHRNFEVLPKFFKKPNVHQGFYSAIKVFRIRNSLRDRLTAVF